VTRAVIRPTAFCVFFDVDQLRPRMSRIDSRPAAADRRQEEWHPRYAWSFDLFRPMTRALESFCESTSARLDGGTGSEQVSFKSFRIFFL